MVETPMPEQGDNLRRKCNHCGARYDYVFDGGDDEHTDRSYCPACSEKRDQYERKSANMRISDDDLKEKAAANLGELQGDGFAVWVDQHPSELYIVAPKDGEVTTPVIRGADE